MEAGRIRVTRIRSHFFLFTIIGVSPGSKEYFCNKYERKSTVISSYVQLELVVSSRIIGFEKINEEN